ncbi:MAG: hypothetical protein IPM59_13520 [Chloracidobacterium sp.]|nr:hypothetical protein [Chloracidobacterium sp.]
MEVVNLKAHFDGEHIVLNEPYELEPDTELVVSVVQSTNGHGANLYALALEGLERAYGSEEPEYPTELIKEHNPAYEGR